MGTCNAIRQTISSNNSKARSYSTTNLLRSITRTASSVVLSWKGTILVLFLNFAQFFLCSTDWVLVYTIYTGYETKLGQCFSRTPLKKTPLDISLQNLITKYNFPLLGILVFIAVVFKSFKVGVTAIDLLFVVKEASSLHLLPNLESF